MTRQEKYRAFAEQAPDLPLFLQPWFLDAVCAGGSWDASLVEKGGRIVAALPWFLKRKFGLSYISMPPLCKFLGPYLLPEFRNLNDETRFYTILLDQIPSKLAAFRQDFNYEVTNWLPFYWKGFRQTTRYSYVITLDAPEADIFQRISKNYRQKIRAAQQKLRVHHERPAHELLRLLNLSFARQGLAAPLSTEFFESYHQALEKQGKCRLFFAEDDSGNIHSAAMLAWDARSAYLTLSGDNPQLRQSGSALLLKWEAIRYAKNELRLPAFDFEGSMIQRIEIGRRDFGAQQKPYFRIQKEWNWGWKLAYAFE